jgi:hypothetical protein
VLLDTGPIVAFLDVRDRWHETCSPLWRELADRCLTTEAVITEASHLIGRGGSPALPLELVLEAGIPAVGLETRAQRHAASLLRRYESVPMDYADATLVTVAHALGLSTVFTLDRRGFRAYRAAEGAAFRLLPRP